MCVRDRNLAAGKDEKQRESEKKKECVIIISIGI